MEDIVHELASTGSTLFTVTDPALRMTVPPPPRSSFQDFGETDWNATPKPARTRKNPTRKRTTTKNVNDASQDSDDDLNLTSSHPESEPPRKRPISKPQSRTSDAPPDTETRPKRRARQPTAFPLEMTPTRDKNAKKSPPRSVAKPSTRAPNNFPSLSPLQNGSAAARAKEIVKSVPADFPSLPPLSSKLTKSKSNNPRSVSGDGGESSSEGADEDEDEDELALRPDDEVKTRGGLRPFPMSKNVLKSIGEIPHSPTTPPTAGPSKLVPSKSTRELAKFPMSTQMLKPMASTPSPDRNPARWTSTEYDIDEHEDSFFLPTDPRTLCPYCDSPLPSSPTPTFTGLLTRSFKHKSSHPDPRPTNPLGRRAPLAVFITVCQRHRFENEILPEAEKRKWPKSIEWGEVRGRVEHMKSFLLALIRDRHDGDEKCEEDKGKKKSPRSMSIFWQEIIKEVENKGTRAVAGVQGQFASFEKTQPGYYGELGSLIIHQTLYNLFPPSELDPTLISPLTPGEFIQRVLVPEVGVRLIMEDQGLVGDTGAVEAVTILRESANYGVAMFPEDGGECDNTGGTSDDEDEEMGAADMIVMERAIKRRQELAVEEREEGEILARGGVEVRKRAVGKSKKGKGRLPSDQQVTRAVEEPASGDAGRTIPKPRPKPKPATMSNSQTTPFCVYIEGKSMEKTSSDSTGSDRAARTRGKNGKKAKKGGKEKATEKTKKSGASANDGDEDEEIEVVNVSAKLMRRGVEEDGNASATPRPTRVMPRNAATATTTEASDAGSVSDASMASVDSKLSSKSHPLLLAKQRQRRPALAGDGGGRGGGGPSNLDQDPKARAGWVHRMSATIDISGSDDEPPVKKPIRDFEWLLNDPDDDSI